MKFKNSYYQELIPGGFQRSSIGVFICGKGDTEDHYLGLRFFHFPISPSSSPQ